MSQNKKTAKEWMAEEFGASALKALSENATTEEYNAFESGGAAVFEQLSGLEAANATLTTENDGLKNSNQELTTKLQDEQAKSLTLSNDLQAMTTERDKYKTTYDEKAEKGEGLPKNDVELPEAYNSLPENHPDRLAYQAFLASKKK